MERFGLPACSVFPGGRGEQPSVALPIVHCHTNFRALIQVGDKLLVHLEPKRLDISSWALLGEQLVAMVVSDMWPSKPKHVDAVLFQMAWTVGWKRQVLAKLKACKNQAIQTAPKAEDYNPAWGRT